VTAWAVEVKFGALELGKSHFLLVTVPVVVSVKVIDAPWTTLMGLPGVKVAVNAVVVVGTVKLTSLEKALSVVLFVS